MEIRCDFPGGNIVLERIEGNTVYLRQNYQSSSRWWFYWNFAVIGAPRGEWHFVFVDGDVIGPLGPAVRTEDGEWGYASQRLEPCSHFSYMFAGERIVYFAWALPYQVADWNRFIKQHKNCESLRTEVLCVSEGNREIPMVSIGRHNAKASALLTCRTHACESVASYVLEGMTAWWIENEKELEKSQWRIDIVPFVDVDGVELGEQGKCRIPHDHYQDYCQEPIYRVTQSILKKTNAHMPDFYLDLHCPYMWARNDSLAERRNEHPFFCREGFQVRDEMIRFGHILQTTTSERKENAIQYDPVYDLEFGDSWFTPVKAAGASHTYFASRGVRLATSLEFPYFGADLPHTPERARTFGANVASAFMQYARI